MNASFKSVSTSFRLQGLITIESRHGDLISFVCLILNENKLSFSNSFDSAIYHIVSSTSSSRNLTGKLN